EHALDCPQTKNAAIPRSLRFELAEGGHKTADWRTIKEPRSCLSGYGNRKRMKILAVLDVVVHVFDDVLGKGRRQDAAIAKRAIPELRASLEPGHDLVP